MAFNDKFGYHEVLHTAHIMACNWQDHVVNHGLMETEPDLAAEASRILAEMGNFYQLVAQASDRKFTEEGS